MGDSFAQIIVVDTITNLPLKETILAGEPCVAAELGKEYFVKVCIHRLPNGQWPFSYVRIGLFVDSVDVQYWKRLDLTEESIKGLNSVCATFWGFKTSNEEIRAFKFSSPRLEAIPSVSSSSSSSASSHVAEGVIRAVIHEAVVLDGTFANESRQVRAPVAGHVVETVKFWQQASATTAAGRNIAEKETFAPVQRWINRSNDPNIELKVKYHTHDMLEFLHSFKHGSTSNRPTSSVELPLKRHRTEHLVGQVCDLTTSSDDESSAPTTNILQANENILLFVPSTTIPSTEEQKTMVEKVIDDEISIIQNVPKVIPMLDITEDDDDDGRSRHAQWSTVVIHTGIS